jgi:diketogulonate reductase-like aldo/keto reductase
MSGVIVGLGGSLHGTSVQAVVREALALGYTDFDTAEVYPRFGHVAAAFANVPRARFRLTSKVDVTIGNRRAQCHANGSGCFQVVASAVTTQLATLQLAHIDTMLLHRPPTCASNERSADGHCDAAVQCLRAQAQWQGLEAAVRAGQVGAIGLSNYCPELLQCVLRVADRVPDVLQQMHHVGMGPNAFKQVQFARALGIQYVAYSPLGGANRQTHDILEAAGSAQTAIAWVRQQNIPVVLLATKPGHLIDNRRFSNASSTTRFLSSSVFDLLSARRFGPQSPSHWGDCVDNPPPLLDSKSVPLLKAMAQFGRERCTLEFSSECAYVARARRMLFDVARARDKRKRIDRIERTDRWAPLEGEALERHADPLGALYAGEVPALIFRRLVRPKALEQMLERIAQRATKQQSRGGNTVGCLCCLLNSSRQDTRCRPPIRGCVWGQKIAASIGNNYSAAAMRAFHAERCLSMNQDLSAFDAHCSNGAVCSPRAAVLRALNDVGAGRRARMGTEIDVPHNPIVAAMAPGFYYSLHYDSLHANAWPPLRHWACGENVPRLARPEAVDAFQVLREHAHGAAAILTLQEPNRTAGNGHDVRIFRARWTDLVLDCAVRSGYSGGIFQRLRGWDSSKVPFVDIRARPGDLYVFNSEFMHITPHIRGGMPRIVLSAIIAYSSSKSFIELFG